MSAIKSSMFAVGIVAALCPLFGCNDKSCDDWYKDVVNQCCAGKANCSMSVDKTSFDNMCQPIDDKCGSSLTCSGTANGAICTMECGCG